MTLKDEATPLAGGVVQADKARLDRRLPGPLSLYVVLGGLILISFVRVVTDANDLTSAGTVVATLSLAIPIGLAGLGGLWSERSGVVNIGLEGMLILGTWFGAAFTYFTGSPWMGIVGGVVGGFLGGILHALATITFGVDHIVSGVAINILALGMARYLAGVFFSGEPGGGATQSPTITRFDRISIPGADSFLQDIEQKHWFFVSDIAGIFRALAVGLTPFTILMILLFPLSWFILWRTSFGLRVRSCGENPDAADSLGVPVYRMKYAAVTVSGILAGLGGAYLADFAGLYREGQTGGRGFIGLAAMIFGNWRPGGLAAGASLFGYTDALQLRQGATSVHALLLFVAVLLLLIGMYLLWRGRYIQAGTGLFAAALVYLWFAVTNDVPLEFVPATPYVITLLVLALASQRLRMPAADGLQWRKGGS